MPSTATSCPRPCRAISLVFHLKKNLKKKNHIFYTGTSTFTHEFRIKKNPINNFWLRGVNYMNNIGCKNNNVYCYYYYYFLFFYFSLFKSNFGLFFLILFYTLSMLFFYTGEVKFSITDTGRPANDGYPAIKNTAQSASVKTK